MKRTIFACITLALLAAASGCHALRGTARSAPENCDPARPGIGGCLLHRGGGGGGGGGRAGEPAFDPGPSSAQVTYPYYTTRGPRDFLAHTPPSIGP